MIRELRAVGLEVLTSRAGYFVHADFAMLKEKLAKRSITTGIQLADCLFSEANVAVSFQLFSPTN